MAENLNFKKKITTRTKKFLKNKIYLGIHIIYVCYFSIT